MPWLLNCPFPSMMFVVFFSVIGIFICTYSIYVYTYISCILYMYIHTYIICIVCVHIYIIYIYNIIYIFCISLGYSSIFIVKIVLRRGSQDMKESNKLYVFFKDPAKKHSVIKLSHSIISPFTCRQGLLKLSRIALNSLYNSGRPRTWTPVSAS